MDPIKSTGCRKSQPKPATQDYVVPPPGWEEQIKKKSLEKLLGTREEPAAVSLSRPGSEGHPKRDSKKDYVAPPPGWEEQIKKNQREGKTKTLHPALARHVFGTHIKRSPKKVRFSSPPPPLGWAAQIKRKRTEQLSQEELGSGTKGFRVMSQLYQQKPVENSFSPGGVAPPPGWVEQIEKMRREKLKKKKRRKKSSPTKQKKKAPKKLPFLTRDLWCLILQWEDPGTMLLSCASVNKSWKKMVFDQRSWRALSSHRVWVNCYDDQFISLAEKCFRGITSIELEDGDYNDQILIRISQICHQLSKLSLSCCHWVTDAGLRFVAARCRSIQSLNLSWCSSITGESLFLFCRYCKDLTEVLLRGNRTLKDSDFKNFQNLKSLKRVDLGFCKISQFGLRAVTESCENLQSITLNDCMKINDEAAQELFKCKKLSTLELCGTTVTDCALIGLARNCLELQYLGLGYCKITDLGLRDVVNLKKLSTLSIAGCIYLTPDAMKAVIKACPKLQDVDVSRCPKLKEFEKRFRSQKSDYRDWTLAVRK